MHPVLFAAGGVTIHTYGVCLLGASLLAVGAWIHAATRRGPRGDRGHPAASGERLLLAALTALLAGGAGSALGAAFLAGSSVQLGVAMGLAGLWWALSLLGLSPAPLVDAAAAPAALGLAVGRLGCLAAGCCHGRPSESALALVYRDPRAHELTGVPIGVPLWPTPILLGGAALLAAMILAWLKPRLPVGGTMGLFLLLDGLSRALIDGLRGDLSGSSATRIAAGGAVLAGAVALGLAWRRRRQAAS